MSDGKLVIVILTAYSRRAISILDTLATVERCNGPVTLSKMAGILDTSNAVYRVYHPDRCPGVSADQVIIDFVGVNPIIARNLLTRSCVPDVYQTIDDRDILSLFVS